MFRKPVYLEERRQRGVTEAKIIREVGGSRAGHLSDPAAGRKAISFMRSLARRHRKAPAGRGWTRELLYDERIGRCQKS
jgi:hypothetical protein